MVKHGYYILSLILQNVYLLQVNLDSSQGLNLKI